MLVERDVGVPMRDGVILRADVYRPEGDRAVAAIVTRTPYDKSRPMVPISALDPEGNPIASWNLDGVYPVKWNGPSLDIGNNQIATETLELSHNGFLA